MREPRVIRLSRWRSPATRYPRGRTGRAEVVDQRYARGYYQCYGLGPDPAGPGYDYWQAVRAVTVTGLEIGGRVWMVDDPPHEFAMRDHARHYRGHVLCAGLGLGLIVHALARNPAVRSVTVVEREPDVTAAVGPHVAGLRGVRLVEADWYAYRPDFEPDGVFFDLFVGDGLALLPAAMRESFELAERFPSAAVIRIHGFGDDVHGLGLAARAAEAAAAGPE